MCSFVIQYVRMVTVVWVWPLVLCHCGLGVATGIVSLWFGRGHWYCVTVNWAWPPGYTYIYSVSVWLGCSYYLTIWALHMCVCTCYMHVCVLNAYVCTYVHSMYYILYIRTYVYTYIIYVCHMSNVWLMSVCCCFRGLPSIVY